LSFGKQLSYISLEYGGPTNHVDDHHLGFKYYLTRHVSVMGTVDYKLSGFQVFFPFIGVNTVYVKDFDIPILLGVNYSYFLLDRNNNRFRNPSFSLNLSVKPRFIYKRLVLSLNLESNWDFSKGKWKSKNNTVLSGLDFKNSYLGAHFSLGFMLFDYKSSYVRVYK